MIDCIIARPDLFERQGPLQKCCAEGFWVQTLINYERPVDEVFSVKPSRVWEPVDILTLRADPKLNKQYIFLADYTGTSGLGSTPDLGKKSAATIDLEREITGEGDAAEGDDLDDFALTVMRQLNEKLITKKTSEPSIVARWKEGSDRSSDEVREAEGMQELEDKIDQLKKRNEEAELGRKIMESKQVW